MKLCAGGRHDWHPRDLFLTPSLLAMSNPGVLAPRDALKLHEIEHLTSAQRESTTSFVLSSSFHCEGSLTLIDDATTVEDMSKPLGSLVTQDRAGATGGHTARTMWERSFHPLAGSSSIFSFTTRADSSLGARTFTLAVDSEEEMEQWVHAIEKARTIYIQELRSQQSRFVRIRLQLSKAYDSKLVQSVFACCIACNFLVTSPSLSPMI